MTDRAFGQEQIQQAKKAMDYAAEQLEIGMRQEHYNDIEYSDAQMKLEQAIRGLTQVEHLANRENRDEFSRLRIQMEQLKNQMVVTPH